MTYLSKNFQKHELECPCCHEIIVNQDFIEALQDLRDSVGRPFRITSGFRCEKHNKEVGGAENSRHLKGVAVDILIRDWSSEDIHKLLCFATSVRPKLGESGVGIYRSWVHFDLRDSNAAWVSL